MALSTVWRLMAHHQNSLAALAWIKQNHRIAIGWGFVGDINTRRYTGPSEISREITAAYQLGTHPYDNGGAGGSSLWCFYNKAQIGDAVIIVARKRELVVKIAGPYEFNQDNVFSLGNYFHQREVDLTDCNPNDLWNMAGGTGANVAKGYSVRSIFVPLPKQVDFEEI